MLYSVGDDIKIPTLMCLWRTVPSVACKGKDTALRLCQVDNSKKKKKILANCPSNPAVDVYDIFKSRIRPVQEVRVLRGMLPRAVTVLA